jgi:small subunit ribosomal protein S10
LKFKIRLASTDYNQLEEICSKIKDIAKTTGVKMSGPIPLPTKKLVVVTRKTPCGEGTHTWDKWEMRVHKRLIYIDANERFMRRFTMLKIPDTIQISAKLLRR